MSSPRFPRFLSYLYSLTECPLLNVGYIVGRGTRSECLGLCHSWVPDPKSIEQYVCIFPDLPQSFRNSNILHFVSGVVGVGSKETPISA